MDVLVLVCGVLMPWSQLLVFWWLGWLSRVPWFPLAITAVIWALLGLRHALAGEWPYAVGDGTAALMWVWLAWRTWRRGKRPIAGRVWARVVDVGHRLAVRPAPVPA